VPRRGAERGAQAGGASAVEEGGGGRGGSGCGNGRHRDGRGVAGRRARGGGFEQEEGGRVVVPWWWCVLERPWPQVGDKASKRQDRAWGREADTFIGSRPVNSFEICKCTARRNMPSIIVLPQAATCHSALELGHYFSASLGAENTRFSVSLGAENTSG
jgi:hypothetical protein